MATLDLTARPGLRGHAWADGVALPGHRPARSLQHRARHRPGCVAAQRPARRHRPRWRPATIDDAPALARTAHGAPGRAGRDHPAERERGLVRIIALDGSLDHRDVLQVRLRSSTVTLADRPIIAPLAERWTTRGPSASCWSPASASGSCTGHMASSTRPAKKSLRRRRRAPGARTGGPAQGTRNADVRHAEHLEARVEEHRAALPGRRHAPPPNVWRNAAGARRDRGARRQSSRASAMCCPKPVAARVVAELPVNAVDAAEGEIADRFEPAVRGLHQRNTSRHRRGAHRHRAPGGRPCRCRPRSPSARWTISDRPVSPASRRAAAGRRARLADDGDAAAARARDRGGHHRPTRA